MKRCLVAFATASWLTLVLCSAGGSGQQRAGEVPRAGTIPVTHGWIVLRPGQDSVPATVDARNGVIDWQTPHASAGLLVAPLAPITGFKTLSLGIWSQKRANAIVMVEDRDNAAFHAVIPLQGNNWTFVRLSPADFHINDDSPVKKRGLDTHLVSPKLMIGEPNVFAENSSNDLKISVVQLEYSTLAFSQSNKTDVTAPASTFSRFANAEMISIRGYTGGQEDPVITPDNQYLFFDSHNDSGAPSYLYWARRINYKTFTFMGKVKALNPSGAWQRDGIEGVEGIEDAAHNYYFVSIFFRQQGAATTIGHGTFAGGTLANVEPIKGISLPRPTIAGAVTANFDLYITTDGRTMYFSTFEFNESGGPSSINSAYLSVAKKNSDGSFTRLPQSDEILKNVNALGQIVYNATPSPDGLQLAFNAIGRVGTIPGMFIATRSTSLEPFGKPLRITETDVLDGHFSEPGSFSSDGKLLYFHRVLSPTQSQIYVIPQQKYARNM